MNPYYLLVCESECGRHRNGVDYFYNIYVQVEASNEVEAMEYIADLLSIDASKLDDAIQHGEAPLSTMQESAYDPEDGDLVDSPSDISYHPEYYPNSYTPWAAKRHTGKREPVNATW